MHNSYFEARRGCTRLAAAVIVCAGIGAAGTAAAQTAPLSWETRPVRVDSGLRSAAVEAPREGEVVFSQIVGDEDAAWVRLEFGDVQLSGQRGEQAYLRITSIHDGAYQILDQVNVERWGYTSAYFNGSWVIVELIAHARQDPSRVVIDAVQIGDDHVPVQISICDDEDSRVLSYAAPDARVRPVGCTAFLFNGNNSCLLTAGHCTASFGNFDPDRMQVVEFNVPLSDPSSNPSSPYWIFSHPKDQYPVQTSSIQFQDAGCGNDWAHFGVFENSNTGLTPLQAQGQSYTLSSSAPTPAGQTIRIRGYGSTTGTELPLEWNLVQKSATGPYLDLDGTLIEHAADTTGGNSGSAIFNMNTGQVIGIHTCAGCGNNWPQWDGNRGTAIHHSNLQDAINDPQGQCGGSCAGHCGGQSTGGCWCDSSCFGFDDCCNDICSHCVEFAQCSCQGNCGNQAEGGCWCDSACTGVGDCCLDVCDECGHCQGACCVIVGGSFQCHMNDQDGCDSIGGIFHGEQVLCEHVLCEQETCLGHCGSQSPGGCWCDSSCVAFGDCCDDACSMCGFCPTGACCFDDGECAQVDAFNCDILDGEYFGDGSNCDDIVCPAVSCQGNCEVSAPGGCWCDNSCFGFGDCCEDVCEHCNHLNNCTFGACCFGDGECEELVLGECTDAEGDFMGADSACDDLVCPAASCEDNCGSQASSGCWCDQGCFTFEDCCEDVCVHCDHFSECAECVGDLNGDNVVDVSDLLILLGAWGTCSDPANCPADLNEDGVVDVSDLLILLGAWGECS